VSDIYDEQDWSGNLGDVWLYSADKRTYRAIMLQRNGEERLFMNIPAKDLNKWLAKLEVPVSQEKREYFHRTFSALTLEDIKKRFEASKQAKMAKTKYLKLKRISVQNRG
jgi:hypothetical protein